MKRRLRLDTKPAATPSARLEKRRSRSESEFVGVFRGETPTIADRRSPCQRPMLAVTSSRGALSRTPGGSTAMPQRVYRFRDLAKVGVPYTRKHVTHLEKQRAFPVHFNLGPNS